MQVYYPIQIKHFLRFCNRSFRANWNPSSKSRKKFLIILHRNNSLLFPLFWVSKNDAKVVSSRSSSSHTPPVIIKNSSSIAEFLPSLRSLPLIKLPSEGTKLYFNTSIFFNLFSSVSPF